MRALRRYLAPGMWIKGDSTALVNSGEAVRILLLSFLSPGHLLSSSTGCTLQLLCLSDLFTGNVSNTSPIPFAARSHWFRISMYVPLYVVDQYMYCSTYFLALYAVGSRTYMQGAATEC